MDEGSILWGLARKRVKWQIDTITGRRRPIQNYYLAEEVGYKHPPQQTLLELERHMSEVASWWEGLEGWWFSGAPSISLQKGYDRTHTNIDIGVMRNPKLLEQMAERTEAKGRFWFERKASWKLLPSSDRKKEILEPIDVHQLIYDLRPNRNPMLLEIEGENIVIGNTPIHHILLHIYEERNGHYRCIEDGLEFPKSTMVTTPYKIENGTTLRLIKPTHMLHKKYALIATGNKNPKHPADIAKCSKR